jgi:SAM-dependent methyltransferase
VSAMATLPGEYPKDRSQRAEFEWKVYDGYYQSTQKLERPFFYHNVKREERFVASLVGRFAIHRDAKILDIGCGNGLYSHLFQRHGLRVTGVDRSEHAIEYCRGRCIESCHWICDDAFALQQSAEYDYAFAFWFMYFNAFEKPTDGAEAGARLMEYLKPTGRLFFLWHSDLTAVRLPPERFSVMNFTMDQLRKFFPGYSTEAYAIDSEARVCSLLGKRSFNKYITRLSCARVALGASSWTRARLLVVVHKSPEIHSADEKGNG